MKNLVPNTPFKFRAFNLMTLLFVFLFSANAQTNVFDDVISTSPDHTYLAAAIEQSGLEGTLQNPSGTFTVFAPTNAAFDDLAAAFGTDINGLLGAPGLTDILLYHVLTSEVPSTAVTNGAIVTPANPTNTLKLTLTSTGSVFINQAKVNVPDLNTDNGVVHSIDAVLLPSETVVDIAIDNGFTSLTAAVIKAELLPTLTNPFATYTVFAPTNEAFDNLATALGTDVSGLLALPTLSDILTYHVLDIEVPASGVTNGAIVQPLSATNTLKLTLTGNGNVFVNQAEVTATDIEADNGIVHVLNAVVLPVETVADVAIDNGFTTLTTAVVTAELLPALTDPFATYTVFAPTNEAFDNLATISGTDINGLLSIPELADIILYHVLDVQVPSSAVSNGAIVQPISNINSLKLTVTSNGGVFVNQAEVTAVDITASNGIVHVLDAVVLPFETVADIAIDNGFTTLTTAVVTAELLPALTDPFAAYTVFAPTNEAFDNLATALGTDVNGLLGLPNLADVLTYHVLDIPVFADDITNGAIVQPLSGTNSLKLTVTGNGEVFVNQANVSAVDIEADNGIVHVLDAVVLPFETVADVAIDNGFSTLTTAVVTAELLPALTDPFATYTVFAPTNEAFNDLAAALGTDVNGLLALPNLADVLTYHVLDSEVLAAQVTNGAIVQPLSATNTLKLTVTGNSEVFVNQANVSATDIQADNGVVHVLDAVVLPVETVADVAIDNGFTTLTTAVVTAELLPALTDPFATYTVFAPTNEAFDNLAAALGTDINGLLALPNLADVLTYHVAGVTVLSTDLVEGTITMLNGGNVTVDLSNGVMINDATVVLADVTSSNGVVHVIDKVLLPTTTSTNDVENASLKAFPNPTSDIIMIDGVTEGEYELFNVSGALVKTGMLDKYIDVANLHSGTYLLRIQANNSVFNLPISKL
jgi:uncharacterized surface protein with fasciclin (FAS1) repeats